MTEIADDLAVPGPRTVLRGFATGWLVFLAIALLLYGALCAWSEGLVHRYGHKNRFFMIATAPPRTYDFAILGASHAMPVGFEDYNERLERAVGGSIINLSVEGAGVLPNRLMIDYFYSRHTAGTVVFFLDSFAFYSRQWNEDRLDTALFKRAPFDPALVETLMRYSWARRLAPPYVLGFTKVNDQDRFAPDLPDSEINKFDTTYWDNPQFDRERVAYLYPPKIDQAALRHYLKEFSALIDFVHGKGGNFMVVKPATPPRYRDALPNEAVFNETIGKLLRARHVPYYDLSSTVADDRYFYDTDHLNRDGVQAFMNAGFVAALQAQAKACPRCARPPGAGSRVGPRGGLQGRGAMRR